MRRPALLRSLALISSLLAACGGGDETAGTTGGSGGAGTGGDAGSPTIEERVSALLSKMSLEEKIEQMHGSQLAPIDGLYWTPDDEHWNIPGFRMVDGPRGVRAGHATTFPVGMARGSTWDPAIEKRVGEAIGLETAAKGGNVILAPTINVLRHPAWGRAQETYGEDPVQIGELGAAFVEGAQEHVIASVKHFAVYSIEDTRFSVDVQIDERTLREVYLPHFYKAAVEARAGSVMTAYNSVNGHFCSENPHLLRDILDGEWGYDGFVVSDWVLGTRSTAPAALAGLDVEMPAGLLFGAPLVEAVKDGSVPESVIDDAVRRILRTKLAFHLDAPEPVDPAVVESAEHTQLALDVARESMVLLKNEGGALPLDRATIGSVVVVGPLAATANLGDHGSSDASPSYAVTPLAGIEDRAGPAAVSHVEGPSLTSADEAAIAGAGAAIVVVGLTADDEGELMGTGMPGGDRHDPSLRISAEQEALVTAVAALNPRTVVVLEGGSAVVVRPWVDDVPALVMAWYPGQEGGHALADVLFGDVSPSGKLPITFPRDVADLPPFVGDQDSVTYDFLHGYRYVDAMTIEPEFPFGFGLGYATFAYADLKLGASAIAPDGVLAVSVDVTSAGPMAGDEIVQAYVGYQGSAVPRAPRTLAAFQRVHLEPGEKKTVSLEVPARSLAYWDTAASAWVTEPITYTVHVGSSSRDLPLSASFTIAK